MNSTREQIIRFNTILSRLGLQDEKAHIILAATDGRTEHSKEVTFREMSNLIDSLNGKQTPVQGSPGDKIRKSILSMCYQMDIINNNMSNYEKVVAINNYIAGHEKIGLKKPFKEYTVKGLQNLHYQFEVFLKHRLNHIEI